MPAEPPALARPMRADAVRNRERLLEVAVRALSQAGGEAVTLEAIAREADVGIGTLYRHFPTREALVEAAYRGEVVRLCDGVGALLEAWPADVALRVWMDHLIDYLSTKRGMADALRALIASGADPFAQTRVSLLAAVRQLLDAGIAEGRIREDADAWDLLTGVSGVSLVAGSPDQRLQAGRLLDLLVDGLRYRPPAEPGLF
jgi:AcrR family transcriptional regulator